MKFLTDLLMERKIKAFVFVIFIFPIAIHAEERDYGFELYMASSFSSIENALSQGADINYKTDYAGGRTALMKSANDGSAEIVSFLLSKGAAIEMADGYGKTALMFAAKKGHVKVVEVLLSNGANMEAIDEHGKTAMMLAAKEGHVKVIEVVLSKYDDIEAIDKHVKTAISIGSKHGHYEMVNILKQEKENLIRERIVQGASFIDGILEPYRLVYVTFNKDLSFRSYLNNVVNPRRKESSFLYEFGFFIGFGIPFLIISKIK